MGVAGLEPEVVTNDLDRHLALAGNRSAAESGAVNPNTHAIGALKALRAAIDEAGPRLCDDALRRILAKVKEEAAGR